MTERIRNARRFRQALNRLALFVVATLVSPAAVCPGGEPPPEALWKAIDAPPVPEGLGLLRSKLELAMETARETGGSVDDLERLAYLFHANGFAARAKALYTFLSNDSDAKGESAARYQYYLADIAREQGDLSQALIHLEAAAGKEIDYPLLYATLGDARFKEGDFAGAVRAYERALSGAEPAPRAQLGMARIRARRGEEAEAISMLEALVRDDSSDYNAQALLAQLLERSGDLAGAEAVRREITHSSRPPENDPWLAPIRDAIFDPQRLDFLFLDYFLVDRFEEAEAVLARMEACDPASPRNFRYRGLLYTELGKLEQAAENFRKGIEAGGDPRALYPMLIQNLRSRGLPREAEAAAREGLDRSGSDSEILFELAKLLFERGDYGEALSPLEDALAKDPFDTEIRLLYARVALWNNASHKATESLEMVRRLAPQDPEVLVRGALVLMESRQYEQALPLIEQALKAAPRYAEAIDLLYDANIESSRTHRASGRFQQALEFCEEALRVRPESSEALGERAQLLIALELYAEAELALRRLLEQVGDAPSVLLVYGDVLYRNGNLSEARSSWSRAARSLPDEPDSQQLRRMLEQRLAADR